MLSKITATTLLMAAIAIGSPIDQLMEPVKRDSVAEGAKAQHLVSMLGNNECMFKPDSRDHNVFELVEDGDCIPITQRAVDECQSFYIQPFYVGRKDVKDKNGKKTSDATCELKYYYDDNWCETPSIQNFTQGYDLESAAYTEEGFCATNTAYRDDKKVEQAIKKANATTGIIETIKSVDFKCPQSYTIECRAYEKTDKEAKEATS
ncbi:unnamed protein product [Zymoseptoria tritici ST99CH_1A5]|uniref:Ecp2 effector protein domain-containing protein n=1 Tax=Zymoseptoria tritici ST99CH_1A5 TaxID=1276529 RepID=A0A1Y6M2G4_ZYMTR|nr:unnamed protein product [Zymoseptoria tritici ST99CH_1A5]